LIIGAEPGMGAWDFFFILVPLGISVLAGGSYAVIALTPADFRLSRRLAWAAGILGMVLVVGFGLRTDLDKRFRIPVVAFLGIVVAVSLTEGLRWITNREVTTTQAVTITPEQQAELKEIDGFLSRKDELELRQEFDLPNILELNIRFQRREILHGNMPKEESDKIDEGFKSGQGILSMKYANLTNVNNTLRVDWIPEKIGVINTTTKYIESRKRLSHLAESINLPADIVECLKRMDATLSHDIDLMFDTLNETRSKDVNNITMNFDYGSPYYGVASGLYWSKFENLRPKVDELNTEIRKYLKVK
jgi:hypothetical protein